MFCYSTWSWFVAPEKILESPGMNGKSVFLS
jgi:hypothetical protein